MSYRSKKEARCRAVLPVGENYLAAFPAMGGPIIGMAIRYRVVVVSDRRVRLYKAGWFRRCEPTELVAELSPDSRLFVHHEYLKKVVHIAGERLWVQLAHWKEVDEAVQAADHVASRWAAAAR